jgi:serine/threonine-protein kinase
VPALERALHGSRDVNARVTGRLVVGRYRLGQVLDQGTLYTTYEAYDVETKAPVAIELLAKPAGAGLPAAKLLRREARRLVDAAHPGLRAVQTVGVEDGVPFVVTAPLSGESLRERLTRSGPLPVTEGVAVALQVIDAMKAAHAGGLVHGNLEPEKVRLVAGPSGATVAMVMGLGVPALLGTMRGVDTRRLGTPPYLAPEQLDSAAPVDDELTDVWGVGLLVVEMLTGRRAFEGKSVDDVARQIATPGMIRVRQLRPEVPLALERIVNATLARSREQRLSLSDLRRALLDVQVELAPKMPVKTAKMARPVIADLTDPCDDAEGTTDLHVHVETDLGSL